MNKRRFRFRISTLLIVTTLVAVGLGWYLNRVLRQPDYKIMEVRGSLAMAPTITREYLAVDVVEFLVTGDVPTPLYAFPPFIRDSRPNLLPST